MYSTWFSYRLLGAWLQGGWRGRFGLGLYFIPYEVEFRLGWLWLSWGLPPF